MKTIKTKDNWFIDKDGRKVFLKGVNLGGSSKVPTRPDGATYQNEGFFDHRNVSFVNRPFSLDEADEHFSRLKKWGFNFLRFIVTWEAIEHAGPDIYDQDYLAYVTKIVKRAGDFGLTLFIDPHQDVWSRFTGGDGAPGWTLEKVGFQIENINDSGAAIVHNVHGDPFPVMIWPTNNTKLAAATMWTLFFAGRSFAPEMIIDGINVQDYLQNHYFSAIQELANHLKDFDHVIGYGSMNEPSSGWIGWQDLRKHYGLLKNGNMPTPWQSILLGEGHPQEVEVWKTGKFSLIRAGMRMLNGGKKRAWQKEVPCIWKTQGIWGYDDKELPILINPFYFKQVNGKEVDFSNDYLKPFINRFSQSIREVDPHAAIFIESEPSTGLPYWSDSDLKEIVNANHWYDGVTLHTKNFNPNFTIDLDTIKLVFGKKAVFTLFKKQLKKIQDQSNDIPGGAPTLIGEFGIPFDMGHKKSYKNGDFSNQIRALNMYYQILDSLFLHSTIWNYTSDNTNERGDQWNDEDLSIFSKDQQHNPNDINSGGRALAAIIRPFCTSLSGEPLSQWFDLSKKEYYFGFSDQSGQTAEFFVPDFHYPRGVHIEVSDGEWNYDQNNQSLTFTPGINQSEHNVRILPK